MNISSNISPNNYKNLSNIESEKILMRKLRAKNDEIKNIKTAINSLTAENHEYQDYASEIDQARSQYSVILNKLNTIRARNKKEQMNLKKADIHKNNEEKFNIEKNKLKFTYLNDIGDNNIKSAKLNYKTVVLDTYV